MTPQQAQVSTLFLAFFIFAGALMYHNEAKNNTTINRDSHRTKTERCKVGDNNRIKTNPRTYTKAN